PNNLRTKSEFYQEFPLAGRLNKVTVALASASAPLISQTLYWWHERDLSATSPAFPGAWAIDSTAIVETRYDPPGNTATPALNRTTVSEIDATSGEVDRTCSIVKQQTPGIVPHVGDIPPPLDAITYVDRRPLFNDTSVWWLGRVDSETVLSDVLPNPFAPLNDPCRVTGAPPCSSTPPACQAVTESPDAKKHTSNFAWNTGQPGYRRRQSQTLVLRGTQEASSSFSYDQWGNLVSKTSTGRDVPSPTPATNYTYTNDKYFVASEARQATTSLSLVSSATTDPKTGRVTLSQAVQGGPQTSTVYDLRGPLTSTTDGTQPVDTRYSSCSVGDCALKRQVFQPGAPIKTEYIDQLGRVIATGIEAFDGNEIVTKVRFNQRGVKISQFEPWKAPTLPGQWDGSSGSAFTTQYSGIDVFGRTGTKTVTRSSSGLLEQGRGNPTLTTTYAYSTLANGNGLRTDITVNNVSGQLTMSRTYDRSNKLVETTQHLSSP